MASHPIYQFYAELCDYEPKIWRRFQVMDHITAARLGYILMTLFEMQACHLFCFDISFLENLSRRQKRTGSQSDLELLSYLKEDEERTQTHIELPCEEDDWLEFRGTNLDASKAKLSQIVREEDNIMHFSYDYGDGWGITLVLEKILYDADLPGKELPRVLEGEGYGIIEDCGGPGGLEELAEAFRKKSGKSYEVFREWLGVDELNLDEFDIDDMNFRLKKVPRIYTDIYEHELPPTKQSLKLLTREYKKK